MPVSRAADKLAAAATAFGYNFRGKTVLDIGSSTGGFTEYALSQGAVKVFAIEKGTKQMKAPLRFDTRIDLREKTDIFTVWQSLVDPIDLILADVSFVSLQKILLHTKKQFSEYNPDFLVMLKPQFEAKTHQLNRGIVKNEKIRREIIKNFELWLKNHQFKIINKRDNQLAGKNGNLERFYWLKLSR